MTGYVIHYTDGNTERSKRVASFYLRTNITQLIPNRAYTMILEATSAQLSGVSDAMELFLIEGDFETSNNSTSSQEIVDNPLILVAIIVAVLIGTTIVVAVSVATMIIITRKCTR